VRGLDAIDGTPVLDLKPHVPAFDAPVGPRVPGWMRRLMAGYSHAAQPERVLAIDHVQLAMPAGREAEARGFYGALLGLPEMPKPAHLAARGGAWFESGQVRVHVGVDPDFRPAKKAHVGLLVGGLRALAGALRSAGHEVCLDEPLEGYERVYVDDPFGNRLELMERKDEAQ